MYSTRVLNTPLLAHGRWSSAYFEQVSTHRTKLGFNGTLRDGIKSFRQFERV